MKLTLISLLSASAAAFAPAADVRVSTQISETKVRKLYKKFEKNDNYICFLNYFFL